MESDHQNGTSCCETNSDGVDNRGYELSANNGNEETTLNGKGKEEIGLEGMNYRQLCNCEEVGKTCSCRTSVTATAKSAANRLVVRLESWDRWKCVALSVLISLIVCWIVIFTALLLTDMF